MSTRFETRMVETKVPVERTCDRCGVAANELNEKKRSYHHRDFVLQFAEGDVFPEGPFQTGWEIPDLCDACVEVLRDLLVANGFKLVKIEPGG